MTVIALVALFALPLHVASMASADLIDGTGPIITVSDIVAGSAKLKQTACQNGSDAEDHDNDLSADCGLCCTAPSTALLTLPNAPTPALMILPASTLTAPSPMGTSIAPQAYQGRAPPFSV